jgi:6-phosphofructokinase 1
MQRGGSPTCKDRFYASIMGAYAADILCAGKSNRVVGVKQGEIRDFDIEEALNMKKSINEYDYQVSRTLSQ